MGGAPLTSVDAFSNEEPAKTVADEPDAAFDSPLLMAQPPQEPPAAAREEAPEITLPTPQAVARQAAQTPKGRLRIDPVRHEHQAASAAG